MLKKKKMEATENDYATQEGPEKQVLHKRFGIYKDQKVTSDFTATVGF